MEMVAVEWVIIPFVKNLKMFLPKNVKNLKMFADFDFLPILLF